MRVLPPMRYRAVVVLPIIIGVAAGQEYAQLWYKQRAFGAPEWFDLAIDLSGAIMGFIVARRGRVSKKEMA